MSKRCDGRQNAEGGRQQHSDDNSSILDKDIRDAIKHMVANISKSFIVEWYTRISPTNHDFVASCETLIENALEKLAELCATKLDKYKVGQLVTSLLHDQILNDTVAEKQQSIENQIDNHEYDICQNLVVRLFGILCTDELRRVIFTTFPNLSSSNATSSTTSPTTSSASYSRNHHYQSSKQNDFQRHNNSGSEIQQTTSALYTLVIAMLTKAVFMQIVDSISEPRWLYAVIIWLCEKEEREHVKRKQQQGQQASSSGNIQNVAKQSNNQLGKSNAFRVDQVSAMNPPIVVTNTRGFRSLDLEEGIQIATGNINFENPVCDSLKRPLDNIQIYGTEEVKSSGSCYVLYCISYDGLCYRHPSSGGGFSFIPENSETVPIIDKRATAMTHRRLMSSSNPPTGNNPSLRTTSLMDQQQMIDNKKSFRRPMTIKRRFREFVLLQLRLEENPKIRPYMKHIPKPTKLKAATQNIFSLPGINNIKLDTSTIKLRQRFLERFLIALNNSPFIANSYEFKEFFSYNVNATYQISKSRSSILQVNLNKVFVDSVRSALSIIRATLPGDDACNLSSKNSQPNPDAWLFELQQSTMKLHIQTRTSHSKMNLEKLLDSKLLSISDNSPIRKRNPNTHDRTSSLGRNVYNNKQYNIYHDYFDNNLTDQFNYGADYHSRGGSLKAPSQFPKSKIHKSNSANSNIHQSAANSCSSSSSVLQTTSSYSKNYVNSSRSASLDSVYLDASNILEEEEEEELHDDAGGQKILKPVDTTNSNRAIQICDSVPIATKFIDIIHYSISRDSRCSVSTINFIAKFLLGRTLERQAIRLLEAAFTLKIATFCINGITSSIWDESDDPPLDLENASLDGAVLHLTKLLESNFINYRFIPKQFLNPLISKQLRFYLSQLSSQKKNKFVIYSFFVHLLDELETIE